MTKWKSLMAVTAAITLVGAWPLIASAQAAGDPHHPDTAAAAPSSTGTSQPQTSMGPGMMGGGQGMMGGQQMMGDMSAMNMMGMMGQGGPGACGPGMAGAATIDRVEGRIAFLRAELKITDAQANSWNAFADALRSNAKKLGEMRSSMMPGAQSAEPRPTTMAARLEMQEKWLAARLDGTRAMKTAFATLYDALSADQKKTADELLAPHMGMGMAATMPMGGPRQ